MVTALLTNLSLGGNMQNLFVVVSSLVGMIAYGIYYKDIKSSSIQPNKWVWMTFGITTIMEALTYSEVSSGPARVIFFISAGCCLVVTWLIWSRAKWDKPSWEEFFCLAACVLAVILWLGFQETLWAHMLMVISVPVAFIPSYREVFKDHVSEDTHAWMIWTIGDMLALVLILGTRSDWESFPYAVVEAMSHAGMWIMVSRGRRKVSN